MRDKMLMLVVFLALLLPCGRAGAQVAVQPLAPQSGLVVKSQLWGLSVTCLTPGGVDVSVGFVLTDRVTSEPFLAGTAPVVHLSQGGQMLSESDMGAAVYTGPGAAGNNDFVPVGLYRVCYQVKAVSQKAELLAEECQLMDVEPMSPPELVFPEDSAVLDTRNPQFLWLPPVPQAIFNELFYDFNLVEILPGQSAQEAVERNVPLYNAGSLLENVAILPPSAVLLDTGRYYAWQVVARNGVSYAARSAAWVFRVVEPVDTAVPVKPTYLELSAGSSPTNVFEVAGPDVYIKYYSYGAEYNALITVTDAAGKVVRKTGRRLMYGDNQIAVRLGAGRDGIYTLELKDIQGNPQSVRFSFTTD